MSSTARNVAALAFGNGLRRTRRWLNLMTDVFLKTANSEPAVTLFENLPSVCLKGYPRRPRGYEASARNLEKTTQILG